MTDVLLIVDTSLSVKQYVKPYSELVNNILKTYKEASTVSVCTFSYTSNVIVKDARPDTIPEIPIIPTGTTSLYDSISEILCKFDDRPRLVIILTDGDDNSSGYCNVHTLTDRVAMFKAKGWKFVFLGLDIHSMEIGKHIGFNVCVLYSTDFTRITELLSSLSYNNIKDREEYDISQCFSSMKI
jgi:hypothetical protein